MNDEGLQYLGKLSGGRCYGSVRASYVAYIKEMDVERMCSDKTVTAQLSMSIATKF